MDSARCPTTPTPYDVALCVCVCVCFLTHICLQQNIFNLTELPKTVAVIGTGPIGCELGQSFQRFGSKVVMFNRSDRMLGKEDPEGRGFGDQYTCICVFVSSSKQPPGSTATQIVRKSMEDDGVEFRMPVKLKQVKLAKPPAPEEGGCGEDIHPPSPSPSPSHCLIPISTTTFAFTMSITLHLCLHPFIGIEELCCFFSFVQDVLLPR